MSAAFASDKNDPTDDGRNWSRRGLLKNDSRRMQSSADGRSHKAGEAQRRQEMVVAPVTVDSASVKSPCHRRTRRVWKELVHRLRIWCMWEEACKSPLRMTPRISISVTSSISWGGGGWANITRGLATSISFDLDAFSLRLLAVAHSCTALNSSAITCLIEEAYDEIRVISELSNPVLCLDGYPSHPTSLIIHLPWGGEILPFHTWLCKVTLKMRCNWTLPA